MWEREQRQREDDAWDRSHPKAVKKTAKRQALYNIEDENSLEVKGRYIPHPNDSKKIKPFKVTEVTRKSKIEIEVVAQVGYPSKKLRRVYDRDKGICHLCLNEVPWYHTHTNNSDRPTMDHIIPYSQRFNYPGSINNIDNLALAHYKCNIKRGNMTVEEFRSKY